MVRVVVFGGVRQLTHGGSRRRHPRWRDAGSRRDPAAADRPARARGVSSPRHHRRARYGHLAPLADGFVAGGYSVTRFTSHGFEDLQAGNGNTFTDVATQGDRICITSRVNHGTTYTSSIRCYDGGAWVQQGDAFPASAYDAPVALTILGDGSLVVATEKNVYQLSGATWLPIPDAPLHVATLAADGQTLYAGGASLQRYANGAWTAIDVQSDAGATHIDDVKVRDGRVYIAGHFDRVEGQIASGVAVLGAGALVDAGDHPLGTGGDVRALLADANGPIAGGAIRAIGEALVTNAAQLRADGWHALGDPGAPINAMLRRADGSIVAGTDAGTIVTWDGTAWTPIAPARDGAIEALLVDGDGLVAAGTFSPGVARWDGTSWSTIGIGSSTGAFALAHDHENHICVGVSLAAEGHPLICQTDTGWAADPLVGGFAVDFIYALPDHSLVVAGALDYGPLQSTDDGGWGTPRTDVPLPYNASTRLNGLLFGWQASAPEVNTNGARAVLQDGSAAMFAAPSWNTAGPPYAQGVGFVDL